MNTFPWANAMQFGFGVLRLSPKDFWAMTPRELSSAFKAHDQQGQSHTPINGDEFAELMNKFPDVEK